MKKSLICIALLASMLSGVTAMAADSYDSDANKVTVSDKGDFKTVIIKNKSTDDIVYVGQNEAGFAGAEFLLKANPANGTYTITMGGNGSAANNVSTDFSIINAAALTKTAELNGSKVTAEDNNGTYTVSFVSDEPINLDNIKAVVVTHKGKSMYTKVGTDLSGAGTAMLGVRILDVPAADINDVSVFVSADDV